METMNHHIQSTSSNKNCFSLQSHINFQMMKESLLNQTLQPTSAQIFECFQKGPPRLIPDPCRLGKELCLGKCQDECNTNRLKQEGRPASFKEIPGIYFSYKVGRDSSIRPGTLTLVSESNSDKDTNLQLISSKERDDSVSRLIGQSQETTAPVRPVREVWDSDGLQSQQTWQQDGEMSNTFPRLEMSRDGVCSEITSLIKMVDGYKGQVLFSGAEMPSLEDAIPPINPLPKLIPSTDEDKRLRVVPERISESQPFTSNFNVMGSGEEFPMCYHRPGLRLTNFGIEPPNILTMSSNGSLFDDKQPGNRKRTREEKLQYLRRYAKARRARETPEQREVRLADLRARQRARKAKETAEQRIKRLEKDREKTLRYRAKKKCVVKP